MPLSTRAVMRLLVEWAGPLGEGYLRLDDVVIGKVHAKRPRWAGWTYSLVKERTKYGLHVVVVLRWGEGGEWRIPVAFRGWRPRRAAGRAGYRTKAARAGEMLKEVAAPGPGFGYVAFDIPVHRRSVHEDGRAARGDVGGHARHEHGGGERRGAAPTAAQGSPPRTYRADQVVVDPWVGCGLLPRTERTHRSGGRELIPRQS